MAFTYDLSTDVGKTRLKLADTAESTAVFSDEELAVFLDEGGDVTSAAILGLKSLLVDAGRRARRFSVQGLSLDTTAQVAALKEAIALLGGDQPTLSAVMPALLPMDAGYCEPTLS